MTYKEKLSAKINTLSKNYNSYFQIVNLQSKEFAKMKKNEVLNYAIEDCKHSKALLDSILPVHEKKLKMILSKCKKDSGYCTMQKESEKKQCGELWAIKKTIREKKEAIQLYRKAIQILRTEK